MANSANYRVQLRRRREGKTDYQARKAMVISGKPRIVTRLSIRNVTAQIVLAKPQGDQVLAAANSRELVKNFGWKAPTGNIPAAYLTGMLCGLKAKAKGIDEAIPDIGLVIPTKGAKTFAVISGVADAGVEVPHSEEKLVKERLRGDHIAGYAKELNSEDTTLYAAKFSKYNAEGVAPEKIGEHFSTVRAAIVASFKGAKVSAEPEGAPAPKAKPKAPKPEAKPAPKVEAKPVAPKVEAPPKAEVKEAKAPRAEAKVEEAKVEAPKAEAKAPKAAKQKAPAAEEAPKEKALKAKKAAPKEKVTEKEAPPKGKTAKAKIEKAEKAPKAKAAAKAKAPKAKAAKKGEKTE